MNKLKSHKTVEQIAKKHRMDVSFIQKQLDMGEPIEHEHTKDHDLAKDIALQHLDEIPDYYSRLKKMEASAKKGHKKFKNVNVDFNDAVKELENELKKLDDISYNSIDKLMRRIMNQHNMTAKELHNAFVKKHNRTPDAWIKKLNEGNLHHWYKDSSSTDKTPGWVEVISGEPCAREEGEEDETPKCVSSDKRASMTKSQRISAQRRKSAADPNQPEKSGAAKPTYVPTDKPKKKMNEQKDIKGKGSGKKDACYTKVKSRYDVWPSAYASGALVKCRNVGANNWGNKTESYPTIAERILGEEKCGKGMYWCNTDEVCKPMPNGFTSPGQTIEPTEVGIGKRVENGTKCNHTKKGKLCPIHNKEECPMTEAAKQEDHEHSMARSELSTIQNAVKRLKSKMKGEGNIEAWVQSKITKAADYLDSAADYVDSGEHNVEEKWEMPERIDPKVLRSSKRSAGIRKISHQGSTEGEKSAAQGKRREPQMPLVRTGDTTIRNINADYEPSLVDKITSEILDEKCWSGYKRKKGTKEFDKGSCVKAENVTIEDSDGNTFAEVVDIIKPEPIKGFKSQVSEATRLQAQTGNVIAVTLSWRGKYYSLKMFFPQAKLPTRKEINNELQKVYPGCNVIYHAVSEIQPGQPLIQAFGLQGGSAAKFGPNKNYVKPMGEEVEISESKKSEMKCNKPKAQAHGSGESGKSHVVKACEDGKEKLIRFGQKGVKGSPKKKGESEEYAKRRHKFKSRHAKNISKGKMSAAYWADKVKW